METFLLFDSQNLFIIRATCCSIPEVNSDDADHDNQVSCMIKIFCKTNVQEFAIVINYQIKKQEAN